MVTSMRVMMAETGTMASGMTEKETGIGAEMTTEITIGLIQHQGGANKHLIMHHDKLKLCLFNQAARLCQPATDDCRNKTL